MLRSLIVPLWRNSSSQVCSDFGNLSLVSSHRLRFWCLNKAHDAHLQVCPFSRQAEDCGEDMVWWYAIHYRLSHIYFIERLWYFIYHTLSVCLSNYEFPRGCYMHSKAWDKQESNMYYTIYALCTLQKAMMHYLLSQWMARAAHHQAHHCIQTSLLCIIKSHHHHYWQIWSIGQFNLLWTKTNTSLFCQYKFIFNDSVKKFTTRNTEN